MYCCLYRSKLQIYGFDPDFSITGSDAHLDLLLAGAADIDDHLAIVCLFLTGRERCQVRQISVVHADKGTIAQDLAEDLLLVRGPVSCRILDFHDQLVQVARTCGCFAEGLSAA